MMPFYRGYFGFDPTYLLVIAGALLSMWASARVNGTFQKYSQVRSRTGMTGADAARQILHSQGIYDVTVRGVKGQLTDHYDPRTKTVNLSESVYGQSSVSAIGVAAHECGHAIQDDQSYAPLRIRNALVPVANIGTHAAWPIILVGIFFGSSQFLLNLGILLFSLGVLFQLVTLPVEFDASSRAVRILGDSGILAGEEIGKTRKVLRAAAMTYVAAAAASILSLLRLILLFGGRDRD